MAMRLFLIYVVVELAVIVALTATIGFGSTLLVLLATFVVGLALAGSQVKRHIRRLQAGLTAATPDGGRAHLELLLLPFQARAHMPISLTGLLAPFDDCRGTDGRGTDGRGTDGRGTDGRGTLGELSITSWRYLHQPERIVPRALRKLAIARGLMVYEGLR